MGSTTCKQCGRQIFFVRTPKWKWMPCEVRPKYFKPDDNGELFVMNDGRTRRGIPSDTYDPNIHMMGYVPHFYACRGYQHHEDK